MGAMHVMNVKFPFFLIRIFIEVFFFFFAKLSTHKKKTSTYKEFRRAFHFRWTFSVILFSKLKAIHLSLKCRPLKDETFQWLYNFAYCFKWYFIIKNLTQFIIFLYFLSLINNFHYYRHEKYFLVFQLIYVCDYVVAHKMDKICDNAFFCTCHNSFSKWTYFE